MLNAFLVFTLIASSTKGQVPTISVTPNPVEIGSNFSIICKVPLISAITFFLDNIDKGTCPPPSVILPCTPPDIVQAGDETSWIQTANLQHEGDWKCSRSNVESNSIGFGVFQCPQSIISASGLSSNLVLNTTSSVDITLTIDCLYPISNLEIHLLFMSGSTGTASTNMSCTTTGSSCSVGSAFECTQQISHEVELISGVIVTGTAYTLHVNALPSTGICGNLSVFESYSLTFEKTGSTSPNSWSGLPLAVSVVLCVLFILVFTYCCSNKQCKTHQRCWLCQGTFYSDVQSVTSNTSEEWNIAHYCCLKPCCSIRVYNKTCCAFLLCFGLLCCWNVFEPKRKTEKSQPLTTSTQCSSVDEQVTNSKRKRKKKKAKNGAKENNDEPNTLVEKHTNEEKAVHTATVNNTKSQPNHPGERRLSLDSLNSKSNKIHPAEDNQLNNTKILDPIMLKSGNVEITLSSTTRPLPVLPPIYKKTS